jgi:hypothetical protein
VVEDFMQRTTWRLASMTAAALGVLALGMLGCGDDDTQVGGDAGTTLPTERPCDPLAPTYCGFPYPNDLWTVADPDSPTGKRLALSAELMPPNVNAVRAQREPFTAADGFSPAIAALTHMPGATVTGLPTPVTIESSLEGDSPTVLLNAETGERVGHWTELDMYLVRAKERNLAEEDRPSFQVPHDLERLREEQALMVRPAVRLDDATRYIVAIRNVVDADGTPLPPSPAFQALRDGEPSDDPLVEGRRAHYEDVFQRLEDAGVARGDLQLAWDYTTASRENNTQWMVHMRDDALANHPDGVPYTIAMRDEEDHFNPAHTACRMEITFEVPLYTTAGTAGSTLVLGEDGMPEQNGTFEYNAALIVPLSAQGTPAPLVQYGHGQLGLKEEVVFGFQDFANEANLAMFALDWKGFAFDDQPHILQTLISGQLENFRAIPERMHQGFLNFLLAMRTLSREAEGGPETHLNQMLAEHCGGAVIDGTRRHYFGGSQGGILGASIMALSTDVERGVLAVPGQPYNILLNRSQNFDQFSEVVYPRYDWNALDLQMVLALLQGVWDRAEPSGYANYIRQDMLPGTPPHEVLIQVSVGDKQVTDLGAHIMARAIGAVNLAPTYRELWGIDTVSGPHEGSGMIEMFFGNTETPIENVPPWNDPVGDPHSSARQVDALMPIVLEFFENGVLENLCSEPHCTADD